jgi:hypothetical protein
MAKCSWNVIKLDNNRNVWGWKNIRFLFVCPHFCIISNYHEVEFLVWMVCHLGFVNWSPKGHVQHNKKLNQGFFGTHILTLMGSLWSFCGLWAQFFGKSFTSDNKTKVLWVTSSFHNANFLTWALSWVVTWIGERPCLMNPIRCAFIPSNSWEPRTWQ